MLQLSESTKGHPFNGKSYEELVRPLRQQTRDYLRLALLGFPDEEAKRLAGFGGPADTIEEEHFNKVEPFLKGKADEYRDEAIAHFDSYTKAKAQMLTSVTIDKMLKGEKLEKEDKQYMAKILEILAKMQVQPKVKGKESADEAILKRHRRK